VNDQRFQMSIRFNRQYSDGDRQLEAARAAGAGIEVKDAFFLYEIRDMGMAVEDDGKFGGSGVEVEGFEIVEQVEVEAGAGLVFDEDDVGFGKLGAGAFAVDVAADRGYRRDLLELGENGGLAHVAEMKDAVDTCEGGSDFRAEEAVGVGDDSELHVFRISRAGGGRLREGTYAN